MFKYPNLPSLLAQKEISVICSRRHLHRLHSLSVNLRHSPIPIVVATPIAIRPDHPFPDLPSSRIQTVTEMDTEMAAASRRMKVVASHFSPVAADELCLPPPHPSTAACLLPMNCSSNVLLNTATPPRRNRIYFARQSSSSQSFFMRQQQQKPPSPPGGSGAQKQDMRPLRRCSVSGEELPAGAPLFSRPNNTATAADPSFCRRAEAPSNKRNFVQRSSRIYELPDYSRASSSSPLPSILPKFAQPGRSMSAGSEDQLPAATEIPAKRSSRPNGMGWSPRMDVRESAGYHHVAVEIPGGDARDMRVEVDDHNLRITGKRSLSAMALPPAAAAAAAANGSLSSSSTYHNLQGPYQIMWPLPSRINKDSISAEFMNGLLLITIPKL